MTKIVVSDFHTSGTQSEHVDIHTTRICHISGDSSSMGDNFPSCTQNGCRTSVYDSRYGTIYHQNKCVHR